MDIALQELREKWAKKFSDLDSEWSHWWIEGDSYCLAVIDGNNLAAAVDIIEDNWEKYAHIHCSRAKIVDGDLMRKHRHTDEISNREFSRHYYDNEQAKT